MGTETNILLLYFCTPVITSMM